MLAGTLSLLQQAAAALQQLLAPIESLAAAAAAAAGAAVAASQAGPQPESQEQLLQSAASRLLLQRSMQLQQDYNALLQQRYPQQQQQQQREESHATGLTHKAVLLQAAAQGWCAFLHGLRQSVRRRLPEVSVLVALITNLQRAAAIAGVGTAAAAAKPKGAAAHEQLLVQANSVLCAYARWLPEAIADGHVDLGKLLLQGQGQVRHLQGIAWQQCWVHNGLRTRMWLCERVQ